MIPFSNHRIPHWQQAATGLLHQCLPKDSDNDLSSFLQKELSVCVKIEHQSLKVARVQMPTPFLTKFISCANDHSNYKLNKINANKFVAAG